MDKMNILLQLKRLGYKDFFEVDRLELGVEIDCLARVIAEHKGVYEIVSLEGESRAVVAGRRMKIASSRDDYPAVGVNVLVVKAR